MFPKPVVYYDRAVSLEDRGLGEHRRGRRKSATDADHRGYAAGSRLSHCILRQDDEVGQVLTAFDDQGLLDKTLVIATSDHGDMDGQHRLIYKGPFVYEHMMRVPLIIRLPATGDDAMAPTTVDFHTVNVDLVPTLADFAGIPIPKTDGTSLKPLLDGGQNVPARAFIVGQYYSKQKWVNPIRMIRTEHYKYNRYREYGEELYDLAQDPEELENLAYDPGYQDVKKELASKLNQWMRDHDDPFDSQNPTTRDGQILTKRCSATRRTARER